MLNTKHTNNSIFSNKAGENFNLPKIFLNVRVRLSDIVENLSEMYSNE